MAPCDTLRDAARDARRDAEDAAEETKEALQEAKKETGKAIGLCSASAAAFAAGIAAGIATTPACLVGIWDAATSWCDVRDSGRDAVEETAAAKDAQAAYLACLNEHKRD